jgi:hypothetical protein
MKPSERAKGAMHAINDALKSLSAAYQSGYRYSRPSSSRPSTRGVAAVTAGSSRPNAYSKPYVGSSATALDTWTDKKVEGIITTAQTALGVLRGMDEKHMLGNQGTEVERADQGLVGKCLSLGMVRWVPSWY